MCVLLSPIAFCIGSITRSVLFYVFRVYGYFYGSSVFVCIGDFILLILCGFYLLMFLFVFLGNRLCGLVVSGFRANRPGSMPVDFVIFCMCWFLF